MNLYRSLVAVLAVAFVGIGIALLVVTTSEGGGVFGYILGGLFIALGVGRMMLIRRGGR